MKPVKVVGFAVATVSVSPVLSSLFPSVYFPSRPSYNACNKATLRLKEIDKLLDAAYTGRPDDYYAEAAKALDTMDGITSDFSSEEPYLSFEEKIDDKKALKVVIILNGTDRISGGFYRIRSWQEISTAGWEGNDRLKLIE